MLLLVCISYTSLVYICPTGISYYQLFANVGVKYCYHILIVVTKW